MEVLDGPNNESFKPWGMELNSYCMLMHFSQFAGFLAPLAGFILPVIMWVSNKDQSELLDQHGKNIVNWIISSLIYYAVGAVLSLLIIGIIGIIVVAILAVVFAIIGAVKAANGEVYKYPFTIEFIK